MPEGTCSIEEFLKRLYERSTTCQRDASSDSRALSERERIDLQNHSALELARDLNLWMSFQNTVSLGVPMPSGVENTVYYNSMDDMMYKMNNLMISHSVQRLFERLSIHNSIFPQTAYQLAAFTGIHNSNSIYPIIKQQYIPNATYATHGEILDYMESLGFVSVGDGTFENEEYQISDLRPRNVLKTPSGSIYVIDADFKRLK